VREGRSLVPQELPLIPGADFAGIVQSVGPATALQPGDAVFDATNEQFTGAYAEYAVASARMVARKPDRLTFVAAASVPVVGCTAWQMVFEHSRLNATTRVLIHGGAGNVGALAVQLARPHAAQVIATALSDDVEVVRSLRADVVIDAQATHFEDVVSDVDVVLDTVGGDTQERSYAVLKPGDVLVASAGCPNEDTAARHAVHAVFFLFNVESSTLTRLASLIANGELRTTVGEVIPLAEARLAHEMLAGEPHRRGKLVLTIENSRDNP
jgi:NADPH:quinone reductase-like Zn-dependent oxidoreductase